MSEKKHKELRAGMLGIIAFAIGSMIFFSGCSISGRTQASVLDRYKQLDAGIFVTQGNK
jgi:hypothetical protein|tara:strand:+ start:868 stop:1044 length:177 start_codon:yes stop_codon:yes gene_type:complete